MARGASVLIVEDEALIAFDLTDMVEDLGYEVCGTAARADEAVALAAHEEPDLVLMDLRLDGGADGVEAAQRIRRRLSDLPIIFITGNTDAASRARMEQDDPHAILGKPVGQSDLKIAIRGALNGRTPS